MQIPSQYGKGLEIQEEIPKEESGEVIGRLNVCLKKNEGILQKPGKKIEKR